MAIEVAGAAIINQWLPGLAIWEIGVVLMAALTGVNLMSARAPANSLVLVLDAEGHRDSGLHCGHRQLCHIKVCRPRSTFGNPSIGGFAPMAGAR